MTNRTNKRRKSRQTSTDPILANVIERAQTMAARYGRTVHVYRCPLKQRGTGRVLRYNGDPLPLPNGSIRVATVRIGSCR